jgi:chorismate mutase
MVEMHAWQQRIVDEARAEIDRIDLELVRLLNSRARQVARIGTVKRELGTPIYQPDREEQIFARVVRANDGPLEDTAMKRVFERILDEARRLERS